MLSVTFRKTIAVIVLNGAFVKRGADDSVESTGVFIGHKKTATEVAVFIIGNYASCWIPATSQSWVEPAGFTKCQTSAKGCGKLLRSSLTVPVKRTLTTYWPFSVAESATIALRFENSATS